MTSPSPLLGDNGSQRLRQLISRQVVEVEHGGNAEAFETGQIMRLVPEQRDANQWHSVIQGLVQAVSAAVCHKGTRLCVTGENTTLCLLCEMCVCVWVCEGVYPTGRSEESI